MIGWAPTQPEQITVGGIVDDNVTDSNSLTKPTDSFYYAVSDLAVGGRCKCKFGVPMILIKVNIKYKIITFSFLVKLISFIIFYF